MAQPLRMPAFPPAPKPTAPNPTSCFFVHAQAEPSVLPRAADLFAKRNITPAKWVSVVTGRGDAELHLDIQVDGLSPQLRERIAACLRQIVYVDQVLTSEKSVAVAV